MLHKYYYNSNLIYTSNYKLSILIFDMTGLYKQSPSLRVEQLHKLFRILLHGRFIFFSLFIYLFWIYQHYFILWIIIQQHLSPSSNFLALAIGSSFVWLPYPFNASHHCGFLNITLVSTLLVPGTPRCSSLISYNSCPSPRFSHFSREPWFLSVKNDTRK